MNIKEVIGQMTLEEKAGLCSGRDFWRTREIPRLGVPSVMVSDGPHGLRKQAEGGDHMGVNESITAVCFPAGCGAAASFDRTLIRRMGETIGKECQAEDLSVVLGPAVNIKRSPLCGRNFEYLSEDPYLAGEMAAAYINGVQSKHVGTSIKHFAMNNQEHERMSISARADERTIREIYLVPFEKAVRQAKPWTVMCSYNRINGTFSSENEWLLTQVLRKEWGFDGYVMSDWAAVNDRVKGILAGLNLEMPGGNPTNTEQIIEAVRSGELPEEKLNESVEQLLRIITEYTEHHGQESAGIRFDRESDHLESAGIAEQCMVLLKNEDHILPLRKKEKGIVFVGGFAAHPRFQGGGSSHINCYRITDALSEAAKYADISYFEGFSAVQDIVDADLQSEAVEAAREASKVVIFAGLPDSFESEGYDRTHMELPGSQNLLIEKICEVNPNVIVVLHNGSPVEMPWIGQVKGVLETYLGGEASGAAVCRLLFGEANPSGKLAETFPVRLEDTPCYLTFPGKRGVVDYSEGVFVGYRYYDAKKMDVLFPFGYGLSYTTFRIDNLKVERDPGSAAASGNSLAGADGGKNHADDFITVSVDVTNTGDCSGAEVVQLYVSDRTGTQIRPEKELKGFEKIYLEPGEKRTVTMKLGYRSFAYFEPEIGDWHVPSGTYEILVGNSSRNILQREKLELDLGEMLPDAVHSNSLLGDLMKQPKLRPVLEKELITQMQVLMPSDDQGSAASEAISEEMTNAMLKYMPIRALRSFGTLTNKEVEQVVEKLNRALE